MKRFLTIFCAIAFSGAALSAQNNADTIRVNRNDSDTLVIIVKEKQSVDRQPKNEQKLAETAQRPTSPTRASEHLPIRQLVLISQDSH